MSTRFQTNGAVAMFAVGALALITMLDRRSVDSRLWEEVRRQYPKDLPIALTFTLTSGPAPEQSQQSHVYLMFPGSLLRLTLIYASASPRDGIAIEESRQQLLWGIGMLAAVGAGRFVLHWRRRAQEMDQRR